MGISFHYLGLQPVGMISQQIKKVLGHSSGKSMNGNGVMKMFDTYLENNGLEEFSK